jgi:hypothetical protein
MRNHEAFRETGSYERDIYLELRRIEERGRRLKQARRNRIAVMLGLGKWIPSRAATESG